MSSSDLLSKLPAAQPPAGVIPNFVNPVTQAPLLIVTGSVFVAVMILFVGARLYAKAFVIRRMTWDDLTCVLATAMTITELVTAIIITKKGVGTHEWDLYIGALLDNSFLIPGYVFVVLQSPTLLLAKLSFYLLFYQIFKPKIAMRWAIYLGAGITTAFYASTSICQFYYQTPGPGQTWISKIDLDPNSPEATVGIATATFGIISDFYLLFLPMFGIWQLQMVMRHKIGIMLVFATGFTACIMSVLCLIYRLKSKNGSDGTWELLPPTLLGVVEESVGVSCSCMPAVSSLIRSHLASFAPFTRLKSYLTSLRFRTRSGASSLRKSSQDSSSASSDDATYVPLTDVELGRVGTAHTYVQRVSEKGPRQIPSMKHYIERGTEKQPQQFPSANAYAQRSSEKDPQHIPSGHTYAQRSSEKEPRHIPSAHTYAQRSSEKDPRHIPSVHTYAQRSSEKEPRHIPSAHTYAQRSPEKDPRHIPSVHTYVQRGSERARAEEGIRLKYEVTQTSQAPAPSPVREVGKWQRPGGGPRVYG